MLCMHIPFLFLRESAWRLEICKRQSNWITLTKWTLELLWCFQGIRHAYRIDGKHSEEIFMALKQVLHHVWHDVRANLSYLLPLLLSLLLLLNEVCCNLLPSIMGGWFPMEVEGGRSNIAGLQRSQGWTRPLWWEGDLLNFEHNLLTPSCHGGIARRVHTLHYIIDSYLWQGRNPISSATFYPSFITGIIFPQ